MIRRATVVAVGKLKGWQKEGCEDYLRRLKKYFPVEVIEVPESDMNRLTAEQVRGQEADRIKKKIPEGAHVVVLDGFSGKEYQSEEIERKRLGPLGQAGRSHIAFIIGGPLGLATELKPDNPPEFPQFSHEAWSFGKITYPHGLARVVLLEQLYRAVKIHRGEPYHW